MSTAAVKRALATQAARTANRRRIAIVQSRRQGLLVRGADGHEGHVVAGRVVPLVEPRPLPAHSGTVRVHELVCVAPSNLADDLRALADFFGSLEELFRSHGAGVPFELSGLKKRGKASREAERTNVEGSVKNLVRWLLDRGVASFLKKSAQATVHLDPVMVHVIATQRLHADPVALRNDRDCRRVRGASRALYHLLDGLGSPLTSEVRRLANTMFGVATMLDVVVDRMKEQNPIEPNTALDLAWREMRETAENLRRLDREIRLTCLRAPYDHAPRDRHPKQALLIGATLLLHDADFSDHEIAQLLDDGFERPGDELLGADARKRKRVKRVRARLDEDWVPLDRPPSYDEQPRNYRTMFAERANAEQIARAENEPDLLWKDGKAYRRVERPGAPPFLAPA